MRMNEKIMNYKFDGSRVFFTSDTHFNHTNIIRFCNRCKKQVFDQQFSEKLVSADFGKQLLHILIDKAVMRQRAAASLLGA